MTAPRHLPRQPTEAAVAHHEAGHAVLSYVLDRHIAHVSIRPNRRRLGVTCTRGLREIFCRNPDCADLWWRFTTQREIVYTLAGPAAELRFQLSTGGAAPTATQLADALMEHVATCCTAEIDEVHDLAAHDCLSPLEQVPFLDWLAVRTAEQVTRYGPAITHFAKHLLRVKEMDTEQAWRFLNASWKVQGQAEDAQAQAKKGKSP